MQDIPKGNVLLFGEMHGSIESPALIYDLACNLSNSGEVAIGLEMPSKDQPLLDSFMKSNGQKSDVEALTATSFWQKGRDGRSSFAMLKLIQDIRALKYAGSPISVFAFDDQPSTNLERNIAIANGIRRFHSSHPDTKIIALMGNIHAMLSPMMLGGEKLVPSGNLLSDLSPTAVSIAYPAGTIWACMPTCSIQQITPGNSPSRPPGFSAGASWGGYTDTYLLQSITASPPAVQQ